MAQDAVRVQRAFAELLAAALDDLALNSEPTFGLKTDFRRDMPRGERRCKNIFRRPQQKLQPTV